MEQTPAPQAPAGSLESPSAAASPPLRSVHTNTFAEVLDRYGTTVAVTTYQAGTLVLLRPQRRDGASLVNTHFRNFRRDAEKGSSLIMNELIVESGPERLNQFVL